MMTKIVKVNKKDEFLGLESQEKCHQGKGILHRAFSILIFNKKNQALLSRRSKLKKLWPLFWDNTCSSHPGKNESYEKAGQRRLKKELGFICQLQLVDKFFYWARYKNVGSENEVCALLVGRYNRKKIKPNPREIADWQWVGLRKLKRDIRKNPKQYTPWLKIGLIKIKYKAIK